MIIFLLVLRVFKTITFTRYKSRTFRVFFTNNLGSPRELVKELILKEGFNYKGINISETELKKNFVLKQIAGSKDTAFTFDIMGQNHIFYIYHNTCRQG